jgi:hypothetical protein
MQKRKRRHLIYSVAGVFIVASSDRSFLFSGLRKVEIVDMSRDVTFQIAATEASRGGLDLQVQWSDCAVA